MEPGTRARSIRHAALCVGCAIIGSLSQAPYDNGGEFTGGSVTGPLFWLDELSFLLFVLSAVIIGFQRRVAYAIALGACVASLPWNLYSMAPGRFLGMFPGESHSHHPNVAWAPWALAGIVASAVTAYLVLRDWNRQPAAST